MMQQGDYRAPHGYPGQAFDQRYPQGRPWQLEQYDSQAYRQQLSYPQLLAPGQPQPQYAPAPPQQDRRHAARNVLGGLGGLVAAVIGISRHRRRPHRADH
jgi:hypothetical protein